jgi:hypothetical protein
MTDDELKIVTVPRELYYHEIAYVRALEQKAKERDELYQHCKALVEMLLTLRLNPVATYAAAYLTQIVPPEEPKR